MSGPKLATLAWRNLWRHRRRTLLTLVSIAFGGFLAVIMTATQDRSFADFIDTAARLGNGHVTIQNPEYQEKPTFSRYVDDAEDKREVARSDEEVETVVDRTSGTTMLTTASDTFGAVFIAYDPEKETDKTFTFHEGLEKGEMFESASDKGIILGSTLARNLGAELGDRVVYTLTDKNGQIVTAMGRLRGVVKTGAPSLDAGLCLLPIDSVRKTLGYDPTETTQVAVFLDDSRRALEVRDRLGAKISDAAVLTWDQIQPEIRAFIAMKVGGGRVMIGFIALLVAAGIFNTLFVSVMERVREFGIMLAIGYSSGQIFRLVFWESLWLALVGVVASAVITAGPYYYLAKNGLDVSKALATGEQPLEVAGVGFDPIMRIGIFPDHALFIVVSILVATLLAGLYPAWKAGRTEPVDTIRVV